MKKSRFSDTQIVAILKEVDAGMKVADVCRSITKIRPPLALLGGPLLVNSFAERPANESARGTAQCSRAPTWEQIQFISEREMVRAIGEKMSRDAIRLRRDRR